MNSCGLTLPKGPSAAINCWIESDSSLHHGFSMKSICVSDLSSQWSISGALNSDLQIYKDDNPSSSRPKYQKSLTCSSHLSEKVPSGFSAKLSSYFKDWIGQLFSGPGNQGDGSKPGNEMGEDMQGSRFRSFLLEYDNKGSSPTFIVKPLEHNKGLLCPSDDPNTHVLDAKTLGERPLFSDKPVSTVLESASFLDVLQNNLSKEAELVELFTYNSSPKKARDDMEKTNRFRSPDALASWLNDRLPSGVSHWGTAPGTKRVANLWMELVEGEIVLEDAYPPRRTVHVASVHIKNDAGHMLIEAHQEMADGSIRHRNRPLSEKMRPGEDIETACLRGISEELGYQLGCRSSVKIVPNSYRQKLEERESLSYPGLLTSYVIHSLDVTIDDLPDTGFYTVEDEMASKHVNGSPLLGLQSLCEPALCPDGAGPVNSHIAVGVKKHFWRWVPQNL